MQKRKTPCADLLADLSITILLNQLEEDMRSTFKPICLAAVLAMSAMSVQARDVACPTSFTEKTTSSYTYNSLAFTLSGSMQRNAAERGIRVYVRNVPDVDSVPRKTTRFGPGSPENRSAAIEVIQYDALKRETFYSRGTRGSGSAPSYMRPMATSEAAHKAMTLADLNKANAVFEQQPSVSATLPPYSSAAVQVYVSAPRNRLYPYSYSGKSGTSWRPPACLGVGFF